MSDRSQQLALRLDELVLHLLADLGLLDLDLRREEIAVELAHDILVARHHDRLEVTCHCTLPDALPMAEVHTLLTALENAFKLAAPEVSRLLIHPEPATDNRR